MNKEHYTPKQLLRSQIRDMLIDIRCLYESGEHPKYLMECEQEVIQLAFKERPAMDPWGWFS